MRYAEMTPEEREKLLDDPDNYPLPVTFLGKTGLLSFEAVELLREHEVDFDVDDRPAAEILDPECLARRDAESRAGSPAARLMSLLRPLAGR